MDHERNGSSYVIDACDLKMSEAGYHRRLSGTLTDEVAKSLVASALGDKEKALAYLKSCTRGRKEDEITLEVREKIEKICPENQNGMVPAVAQ